MTLRGAGAKPNDIRTLKDAGKIEKAIVGKPKSTSEPVVGKKAGEDGVVDIGDVVDKKAGKASSRDAPKSGTVSGGQARKSAVHARMGDVDVTRANKKKEVNAKDNPEWFWNGHKKWKTAPPGVKVTVNPDANKEGSGGWIEKWQSPSTGKWVHNYTVDEMQRKAGEKFVHNRSFADNLQELRAQLGKDLKSSDPKTREKALIVSIIDQTYIRIGNEESTKRSSVEVKEGRKPKEDTFGITTMEGRHLSKDGTTLTFKGKAEVDHVKVIGDMRLVGLLRAKKKETGDGERLFSVSAGDVNAYLEPFGGSAKSFRTYHATRLAHEGFAQWAKEHPKASVDERKAAVLEIAGGVAEKLGHTREVCLGNYIDPAVVVLFERGKLG